MIIFEFKKDRNRIEITKDKDNYGCSCQAPLEGFGFNAENSTYSLKEIIEKIKRINFKLSEKQKTKLFNDLDNLIF